MYTTRNSARLQQEKETEHNNQLLSFFNGKNVVHPFQYSIILIFLFFYI